MQHLPAPGTVAGEVIRAVLAIAAVLLILLAAEGWRRRSAAPAEWTRKLAHFSSGMVVASFPWVFASPWTVAVLALLFALFLWGMRRLGLLGSLHCVDRRSEGDYYYLLAVFLLFVMGRHRPLFYLVAVLVLMVADTVAALLGSAYGRWTYPVEAGRRSLEGSAVFFLTAFLCVHLPLLLLTQLDRAVVVLVSLQVALLVTAVEAVGVRGNDNLLVPTATYLLLVKLTPYSARWIALQLGAQVAILGLAALLAWRSRVLAVSGAIAASLFFYGAWLLGGPVWTLPPALALLGYMGICRLSRHPGAEAREGHQVGGVFYVSVVAVLLLFAQEAARPMGHAARSPGVFYVPFVGALAGHLAITTLLHLEAVTWRRLPGACRIAGAGVLAFGTVIFPALGATAGRVAGSDVAVAALICAGGLLLYCGSRRALRGPDEVGWELRLQAASVAATTLLLLPVHFQWLGGRP